MRLDLQILRHAAPVCVRIVYLYKLCVWGVVKSGAGNSIMVCAAHMSGASFFALSPWLKRSHFHVWQQSSPLM